MSEVVVRVDNLGKRYRIGEPQAYKMLRDTIARSASDLARRLRAGVSAQATQPPAGHPVDHVWALSGASFEVRRGERVGIIGANGSGKSTLLKILCRIVRPTIGRTEVHGRLGALLEVGTGFHPELTGRENIFFNGAILGLRKAEITRKLDEIVDFSGIEPFLDTPLKHYSSGMQVRLAFSVAAQLAAEVLIVDEVLSVGDTAFQEKSIAKMKQAALDGRTVLFVSHGLDLVRDLCTRAILLRGGHLCGDGPVEAVIEQYEHLEGLTP